MEGWKGVGVVVGVLLVGAVLVQKIARGGGGFGGWEWSLAQSEVQVLVERYANRPRHSEALFYDYENENVPRGCSGEFLTVLSSIGSQFRVVRQYDKSDDRVIALEPNPFGNPAAPHASCALVGSNPALLTVPADYATIINSADIVGRFGCAPSGNSAGGPHHSTFRFLKPSAANIFQETPWEMPVLAGFEDEKAQEFLRESANENVTQVMGVDLSGLIRSLRYAMDRWVGTLRNSNFVHDPATGKPIKLHSLTRLVLLWGAFCREIHVFGIWTPIAEEAIRISNVEVPKPVKALSDQTANGSYTHYFDVNDVDGCQLRESLDQRVQRSHDEGLDYVFLRTLAQCAPGAYFPATVRIYT